MGLFDTIQCDYPMPDSRHQDLEFHTKSLDCAMEQYTITADGRLLKRPGGGLFGEDPDDPTPGEDEEQSIHGDIEMHQAWDPGEGEEWAEYRVRFTRDRVEWIRPLSRREETGAIITSSPAPSEPARTGPPTPGLMGRRLKAEEFGASTPEKLELIDGEVPGAKHMLLLLLTSFGLRRTAALVGYDLWRRALPE